MKGGLPSLKLVVSACDEYTPVSPERDSFSAPLTSAVENVVRLAAYRRRRRKLAAPVSPGEGPRYFCTRCDADEFRVVESGAVHCAACGSMMRNLRVSSLA
jgi:hypothetical protein